MIVTLTANPSIDRTVSLAGPLIRGEVLRTPATSDEPGGKGINVTRALLAAGAQTLAVLPANHDDPLTAALRQERISHRAVPVDTRVRVNLTLSEPDGTTTKVNSPGEPMTAAAADALAAELLREATGACWVVLSGSLPPGVPDDWYVRLVAALRGHGCRVAVDTSGTPLRTVLAAGAAAHPHLVTPNGAELADAIGGDAAAIESDPYEAARAASLVRDRGVESVLVTLGAAGAVLVDPAGAWFAAAPSITPRSTVGAGDCSLAGYLLAQTAGRPPSECLAWAVAYGSAAASLPGSAVPRRVDVDAVVVSPARPLPVTPLAVSESVPTHPASGTPAG